MIRHLGYACINTLLRKQGVFNSRTCRIKSYSIELIDELVLNNCLDLMPIIQWNESQGIKLFRISSDIFPFMDHPELGYKLEDLPSYQKIKLALSNAGDFALNHNHRLTSHPGPYTVLSSESPEIIKKSIQTIEMHRILGEHLGLKDFIINVHLGTKFSLDGAKRFIDAFRQLTFQSQKWLTIENDDKASGWSVSDLYNHIAVHIPLPIILDIHHWRFCQKESLSDAAQMAKETWRQLIPKFHYSESAENKKPTAHSDYIHQSIPDFDFELDYMIEAKAKEQALLHWKSLVF